MAKVQTASNPTPLNVVSSDTAFVLETCGLAAIVVFVRSEQFKNR
jgi:hypothetical protein